LRASEAIANKNCPCLFCQKESELGKVREFFDGRTAQTGKQRVTVPYFKRFATLATPALAQPSSISCPDPELPKPPIVWLPALIGAAAQRRHYP
jgi:hypothetical protein